MELPTWHRRIKLEVTDQARRFIAQEGYDPVYGARPLRRFLSREVETRIGRALLGGDVRDGAVIRVDVVGGELVVTYSNPEPAPAGAGAEEEVEEAGDTESATV